ALLRAGTAEVRRDDDREVPPRRDPDDREEHRVRSVVREHRAAAPAAPRHPPAQRVVLSGGGGVQLAERLWPEQGSGAARALEMERRVAREVADAAMDRAGGPDGGGVVRLDSGRDRF